MTGGRGQTKSSTSKTTITLERKSTLMEFTPYMLGKHQVVTFDAVKEQILQKLQIKLEDGHDIVDCLRAGKNEGIPLTRPKRMIKGDTEEGKTVVTEAGR